MRLIVIYDISDDRDRETIARKLKNLGLTRIQRSAFIGRGGKGHAKDVWRAVQRYVKEPIDSLIVFIVPDEVIKQAIVLGVPLGGMRDIETVQLL